MLHKESDINDPGNFRPIALVNCITKVFTNVLTNRIAHWVEQENLLPEFQSGFRKQRSCVDNIFVLNTLVQNRLSLKGGKVYTLFVDFSNAFLSVSHNLLWSKLYKLGMGYKLTKILKDFYAKATVSVQNNESVSTPVGVTKGVL